MGLIWARIYVMPEGIAVKIDGGDWQLMGAATGSSSNGANRVGGLPWEGSFPECNITWLGAKEGSRGWSVETFFHMQLAGNQIFLSGYQVGETTLPSPGYLNVYSLGPVGGYITGKFRMDRASSQKPVGDKIVYREHQIDGVFRVRRLL